MTQYLPPNLLALFAARDPVQYKPPVDKLVHEKKRAPYKGLAEFTKEFEDSKDTPPPTRVETREERKERKVKERAEQHAYKLEQDLALWDPTNYPPTFGDPFKTLFIARINYDTSESKLRREFEVYGPIKKIHLTHDRNSGKPRGYAFIEYEHERDMHSAYKHADGKKIDGRRVLVDVERGRTVKGWRPRRLGGGLGGTRKGGPEENTRFSGRDEYASRGDRDSYRSEDRSAGGGRERSRERSRERDRDRERDRRRRSRSRDRDRERRRSRSRERDRGGERADRADRERRRSRSRDRGERSQGRSESRDPRDTREPRRRSKDREERPPMVPEDEEELARRDRDRKRRRSRSRDRDRRRSRSRERDGKRRRRSRSRERPKRERGERGGREERPEELGPPPEYPDAELVVKQERGTYEGYGGPGPLGQDGLAANGGEGEDSSQSQPPLPQGFSMEGGYYGKPPPDDSYQGDEDVYSQQ